jgi:predicted dehydrogenase
LSEVFLFGSKGDNTPAAIPVPERFTFATPDTPSGEARNVGQMYTLFARAIREGESRQPTFETAVDLHRLIDAIKQASDNGRELTCE